MVFALMVAVATSCADTGAWRDPVVIPGNIGVSDRDVPFTDFRECDTSVLGHWSDGDRIYIVDFLKFKKGETKPVGRFLNLSRDGGGSFEGERAFGDVFKEVDDRSIVSMKIRGESVIATFMVDSNLEFASSKDGLNRFSRPVRINDSPNSVGNRSDVISLGPLHSLVVWQDLREGGSRLYYSVSEDGGKTWGINQKISNSPVAQGQERVRLAEGSDGRIFAAWMDWRSKKTLVDIRGAYSDDGGKTWSEDFQINDDGLSVWQMDPAIIADGPVVFVAFSDFRDLGPDGDNDWNIYYSRSTDNGVSWEPNKRLNSEVEARQATPQCGKSKEGGFFCAYHSGGATIFGQSAFVASSDRGKTWSNSSTLGSVPMRSPLSLRQIAVFSGSRFRLVEKREHKSDSHGKVVTAEPGFSRPPVTTGPVGEELTVQRKPGESVFSDDFSGDKSEKWTEIHGNWSIENGWFMGSVSNRNSNSFPLIYKAIAPFPEPREYELSGRFRLDPVSHIAAVIYFRDEQGRHFSVTNQFRHGAWIGFDDGNLGIGHNFMNVGPWTQTVLAEKSYSFRKGTWYKFRLLVTQDHAEYYVNGKLFLSANVDSTISPGNIGLGGFSTSPTYFDDIEIRLLEE